MTYRLREPNARLHVRRGSDSGTVMLQDIVIAKLQLRWN